MNPNSMSFTPGQWKMDAPGFTPFVPFTPSSSSSPAPATTTTTTTTTTYAAVPTTWDSEPAPRSSAAAATTTASWGAPVGEAPQQKPPTESVFTVEDDDIEEDDELVEEVKKLEIVPQQEYVDEDKREHLNVIFIGHVDAGKSTISGQVMLSTGQVDARTLEKYEREAKENNRESWFLAYIMDTNEEERAKGKTVEVGRAHFETDKKRYTILDAPGHKNYVPNMIGGAAQSDVAILVISARRGEFETGFEKGGQSREHVRLVKTIGVKYLIIVINKMDDPTVEWEKSRYDECVDKLTPFLKSTGYNVKKDVIFIPVSGLTGANIMKQAPEGKCPWYEGLPLLPTLDALTPIERKADAPLRIPVVDSFKDRGLTVIMGKVEAGTVTVGQNIFLMPGKIPLEVTAINTEISTMQRAKPGENIKLSVRGIEEGAVSSGFVLSDANLVPCVTEFECILAVQELSKEKTLMTAGYEAVLHLHTAVEECVISELVSQIDPKTNKDIKKKADIHKE
eukprot:TRINITY_DN936_c0_g1_i1.p1 TRINITY_DN936_c0_g1~~TRINITY_DN936_c0_g1_i1.p1  ORF type:complete len:541 (+),score=217.78 TRINITY_DN936_c0_g1_i1:98-1624(+)